MVTLRGRIFPKVERLDFPGRVHHPIPWDFTPQHSTPKVVHSYSLTYKVSPPCWALVLYSSKPICSLLEEEGASQLG